MSRSPVATKTQRIAAAKVVQIMLILNLGRWPDDLTEEDNTLQSDAECFFAAYHYASAEQLKKDPRLLRGWKDRLAHIVDSTFSTIRVHSYLGTYQPTST
ncbi:hypothetical protein KCU88_g110, partial [Aureobasidium melanogenum]